MKPIKQDWWLEKMNNWSTNVAINWIINDTYLKDKTGPTSLNISFSFSSVASYGIFPTEMRLY